MVMCWRWVLLRIIVLRRRLRVVILLLRRISVIWLRVDELLWLMWLKWHGALWGLRRLRQCRLDLHLIVKVIRRRGLVECS
jgi:hypothetical protein